ncbi:MAG: preprotein translocase subunit SecA [Candidatus Brennerbacteria bacterium]|nr:preprotein translocase subunit SecA [Candidatus Brennerbacteria bacterium]
MSIFSKLFENRIYGRLRTAIEIVNAEETAVSSLSDEELKKRSRDLREKILNGGSGEAALGEALPGAFSLVREAAKRTLKQRHYDVQLMGGMVLHEGKIAEMMTGEGKTLAATAPAYLNALAGEGVHIVTVNDYLAKRDAVWMGQIYHMLGVSVACLVHDAAYVYDPSYTTAQNELDKKRDTFGSFKVFEEFLRPVSRKEAYTADITYGTNHEFGFDFLRDNLALRLADRVQRSHHYAVIDEVDSILIDEARTPLIIAAPDVQSSEFYKVFAKVAAGLIAETDYIADEKQRTVNITNEGIEKVEKILKIENLYAPEHSRLVHFLEESLKAKALFKLDRDYMVKSGEVLIVDQFTGRILHGRRYSGGLHQAIEAKEGVLVREENRTYAQITIQNYFRLYKKIAGMTGTAATSAEEFHKVYNLEVVPIPPNRLLVRKDVPDVIYKTKDAKYDAVVREVKARQEKGQPVLLGTTSIVQNEEIAARLAKAGIPHEILNAKNNEREGAIIAQAGRKDAVTVATNMAGRGVDIVLGGNPQDPEQSRKVMDVGGLHVIGTERHEARRIDNQLRGRSGRQGDPGSTQFFLSLEDDLLRIFGGERIKRMMETFDVPDDIPIESGLVTKAVNQAQEKVEGMNFDIRKHLLDFDDVLNKQRAAFYAKRERFLKADGKEFVLTIKELLSRFVEEGRKALNNSRELLSKGEGMDNIAEAEKSFTALEEKIAKLPEMLDSERAAFTAQHLVRLLDMLWVDHLENLEGLRETVNIRAYAQHEPLVEYRREAHTLFKRLESRFETMVAGNIFQVLEVDLMRVMPQRVAPPPEMKDIGRNDPCWCGSGKKYKKCHEK